MKRIMVLVLIFFIVFASNFQYILNATNSNGDDFEIGLDESTEEGQAVLHVTPKNEGIKGVMIELPSETTFDKTLTQTLNENRYELTYEKEKHLTTIEWGEDFPNGKVYLALTDIEKESNKIYVEGLSEDQQIQKQDFSFEVDVEIDDEDSAKESKAENEEIVDENTKDEKSTDLEVSKNNENDESDDTNTQSEEKGNDIQDQTKETKEKETESVSDTKKEDKEKETSEKEEKNNQTKNQKDEEKDSTESNTNEEKKQKKTITPFVGDLNVDIDISPHKEEIESGKAAKYNLVFKTTGSQKEYNNAEIIVDLPINDYTAFNQDLDELKIAGVVPSYNSTDHTLTYQFDQLKTGQTYDVMIKIDTKNGYTPSGTILEAKASFESDERDKVQDEATVTVTSSSAIHINKIFTGEVWNGVEGEWQKINPLPDHITKWLIEVEIPKKDIGQMYLKEGSKIVVTDTLPDGLSYDLSYVWGTESLTTPRETGNQLIWEFDAPSLEEQESAEGSVFTRTIEVWLRADMDTEKTYQNNTVDIEATLINDVSITDESEDSIYIYGANGDSNADGFPLIPPHFAPANGEGQMGASDDFPLEVYDDAWLKFGLGIGALYEGQYHDFKELTYSYHIDENLTLTGITTPGKWRYYPDSAYYPPNVDFDQLEKLEKNPTFDIYANVNGQEKLLIENAESSKYYSRKDLDLNEEDVITNIEYRFTYAPKGLFATEYGNFDFSVEEGYIGQVENYFTISGFGGDDQEPKEFYYDTRDKNDYSIPPWSYPRKVTIIEKPENAFPVATVGVSLEDHNKGEVVYGPNRMEVTLDNRSTSAYSMKESLETVVLLPIGVKVSETPNDEYSNNKGGNYEVIDNYNGTGRQLVKFTWNEEYLRYQDSLKAWIDVDIEETNLSSLKFDVYGFSGDEELRVPSVSGNSITDTILQTDDDDLNGDGVTDQPRIKSGNIYTIRGEYDLQTEKFVKGELDEDWNKLGQTTPGGHIDYKLHLTNTTGKDITTMTLIDVLPSVGDLGITDNISRGSKFTPTMKGPITLPSEWEGKVKVFYSEAQTPKRDDLIRHTKYPETTTPLSNPEGAESPNWMTEADVEDWNTIHSFKIELIDGETWVEGTDMEILFSMKAPEANDVDASLLDKNMEPKERAAWNSFAVATDHGQPVEPAQVGVYMNYEIEEPEVEKTVNEQKETYELINRNEQFTWEVKYEFGNHTGNWESVSLSDQINELLEIGQVTVIDQNGTDVTDNGDLTISENNLVTFDLKKKDGSFKYLQNQTYTMIIESQIKESVKNEELLPYIKEGGIPNQAELIINDDPKPSNEVKVKPPALKGSLQVIKQDKEDNEKVLKGAAFELLDEEGQVVAQGETDSEGKLVFRDLPLGKYQLVETKAPEGYRLLKKPLDVEITSELLEVELEVENSKTGWDLPLTGGIGTLIFYGLGALLMVGALLLLFKRKKTTKQIEE